MRDTSADLSADLCRHCGHKRSEHECGRDKPGGPVTHLVCPRGMGGVQPDEFDRAGGFLPSAYYAHLEAQQAKPAQPTRRMSRRVVYISGPLSRGDLASNISRATAAFKELAEAGLAPICPHWSCFSGGVLTTPTGGSVYAFATAGGCGLPHQEWVELDTALVERSDAVLRLSGESVGADLETEHAAARGIPVFHGVQDVIRWAWESGPVAVS